MRTSASASAFVQVHACVCAHTGGDGCGTNDSEQGNQQNQSSMQLCLGGRHCYAVPASTQDLRGAGVLCFMDAPARSTHPQALQQEVHKGARARVRLLEAHVEDEELGELGAMGVEDGALKDGEQRVPSLLRTRGLLEAPPAVRHAAWSKSVGLQACSVTSGMEQNVGLQGCPGRHEGCPEQHRPSPRLWMGGNLALRGKGRQPPSNSRAATGALACSHGTRKRMPHERR